MIQSTLATMKLNRPSSMAMRMRPATKASFPCTIGPLSVISVKMAGICKAIWPNWNGPFQKGTYRPVSYTHLTLPTRKLV